MPLGHFAAVLGTSSGFGLIPFPETQGQTSGTDGFAPRAFSPLTKTDLGVPKVCAPVWGPPDGPRGLLNVVPAFGYPSGGPKSGLDVWDHPKTHLGGTFPQIGILSPSGQTLGLC